MSSIWPVLKHKISTFTYGGPAYDFVSNLDHKYLAVLAELMEEGVKPYVDQVFPIQQASEAHKRIDSHHGKGKIVLKFEN